MFWHYSCQCPDWVRHPSAEGVLNHTGSRDLAREDTSLLPQGRLRLSRKGAAAVVTTPATAVRVTPPPRGGNAPGPAGQSTVGSCPRSRVVITCDPSSSSEQQQVISRKLLGSFSPPGAMAPGSTEKDTPGSLVLSDSSSALQGATPACSVLPGHPDYQEQRDPAATPSACDGLSAKELTAAMLRDSQFQGYMAKRHSSRGRSAASRRSASSGSADTPRRNLHGAIQNASNATGPVWRTSVTHTKDQSACTSTHCHRSCHWNRRNRPARRQRPRYSLDGTNGTHRRSRANHELARCDPLSANGRR